MTDADTRARILLATVIARILAPRLEQYGIKISLNDVLDLFVVSAGVWHTIGPYLQRWFPPPTQNASAVTPFLSPNQTSKPPPETK